MSARELIAELRKMERCLDAAAVHDALPRIIALLEAGERMAEELGGIIGRLPATAHERSFLAAWREAEK